MKHLVPGTRCSLLSAPSKMPGYAFGIPAKKSCTRMNGNICENCYACNGFYRMRNVQNTQQARFDWTRQCLKSPEGTALWIDTLTSAILAVTRPKKRLLNTPTFFTDGRNDRYFRIHDSGDFFNAAYVRMWHEVCRRCADVMFWAPTRVWQQPISTVAVNGLKPFRIVTEDDLILAEVLKLAQFPNVTIRPSALNFGDAAPIVPGLHAGSGADSMHWTCPAHEQNNQCGSCRLCWHERAVPVTYRKH